MFGGQLLIGFGMIVLTVLIHMCGVLALIAWLRRRGGLRADRHVYIEAITVLVATVLSVFLLHMVEIWAWALLYLWLGEFEGFARALYFSTVTFTALGYGDITLGPRWQLLSGLEAANGIILFGVSIAFVFAVLHYVFKAAGIGEQK